MGYFNTHKSMLEFSANFWLHPNGFSNKINHKYDKQVKRIPVIQMKKILHRSKVKIPKLIVVDVSADNKYLSNVINSLNPRIAIAASAHGGGSQLLFLLFASWAR